VETQHLDDMFTVQLEPRSAPESEIWLTLITAKPNTASVVSILGLSY